MHLDIQELIDFYQRPLGIRVRRILSRTIREHWRNVEGMTILGLGYATPYLGVFRSEALRLGAMMPAGQGATQWPPAGSNRTILVNDIALPLPDASVDRMLVVHHLELCEAERQSLRELWRVLKPEGRMMLVVPNRRGIWARLDTTPFGFGRPYSRSQIERLLNGAMFAMESWRFALATPPIEIGALWASSISVERLGSVLWPLFSGVILVEASKQVLGTLPKGTPVTAREAIRRIVRPVPAPQHRNNGW